MRKLVRGVVSFVSLVFGGVVGWSGCVLVSAFVFDQNSRAVFLNSTFGSGAVRRCEACGS